MENTITGTILIAEDNAVISNLNERILSRSGHTVITARNGKEAWELIASGNVELAILDLEMPVMDGFEVLKRIRNHAEIRNMPVIILTASYQSEDKIQSIDLGADLYITKPVGTNELRLAVTKLLDKRAFAG